MLSLELGGVQDAAPMVVAQPARRAPTRPTGVFFLRLIYQALRRVAIKCDAVCARG